MNEYESAIIGITSGGNIVYSQKLMVDQLVIRDGMTKEEAAEFIEFNTKRIFEYMPNPKPIIVYPY